ncbi:hypothetical protein OG292_02935 [Streptomyces sp. NBC_01511]|uniref:hypothetical protein n=1 Tax=Streptomyces sp. NBC_01511 TaxID=2903889 RepID=UPI00386FB85A
MVDAWPAIEKVVPREKLAEALAVFGALLVSLAKVSAVPSHLIFLVSNAATWADATAGETSSGRSLR